MSLKTFVPIFLIVACASFVFFVRPSYVEGRIGLGITALLTLVALQLTSGASLPDVDYLTMLDKMFLHAYLFFIITLGRVVVTSWPRTNARAEGAIARGDRAWVTILARRLCRDQSDRRLDGDGLGDSRLTRLLTLQSLLVGPKTDRDVVLVEDSLANVVVLVEQAP
jgi:hypothetical protein